jgi:diaminopimelate decarboxylase
MNHFVRKDGELYCEETALARIAADVGTPCYVYSRATLERHYRHLDDALSGMPHVICFAVKANSNVAVLHLLAGLGAGADVVSGGELYRSVRAGMPAGKIVFAGNGKTEAELRQTVECGIMMVNVDSKGELRLLEEVAADMDAVVPIALRVNPDVDPKTHPYIATGLKKTKFGVAIEDAVEHYRRAAASRHLKIVGIHTHIGSQITDVEPFVESVSKLADLAIELRRDDIDIEYIDLGGGIGITYHDEEPPSYESYAEAIAPHVARAGCTLVVEPGRSIAGNAGILLAKVLYVKRGAAKQFVVVDAAMNDLMRPTLYDSYHEIVPVVERNDSARFTVDVVGGICESSDFLARERDMPQVKEDDLVAVMSAGAYGSSMSSTYNSRPLVPEVLVDGAEVHVVRRRQTFDEMLALETDIPDL